MVTEKVCVGCKQLKPASEFHADPRATTGLQSRCKECYRKWYIANKARHRRNEKRRRKRRKTTTGTTTGPYYHSNKNALWFRFRNGRVRAKKRKLEWSLTIELYDALCALPCEYCCFPFNRRTGLGLDRVDSKRGYTPDNVVPCCGVCNSVKMDVFTRDEMKVIGAVIRELILKRNQAIGGPQCTSQQCSSTLTGCSPTS